MVYVGHHSVAQQRGEEDTCGNAQLVQGGDDAAGLGRGDLAQQHGGHATGDAHTQAWKTVKIRDNVSDLIINYKNKQDSILTWNEAADEEGVQITGSRKSSSDDEKRSITQKRHALSILLRRPTRN